MINSYFFTWTTFLSLFRHVPESTVLFWGHPCLSRILNDVVKILHLPRIGPDFVSGEFLLLLFGLLVGFATFARLPRWGLGAGYRLRNIFFDLLTNWSWTSSLGLLKTTTYRYKYILTGKLCKMLLVLRSDDSGTRPTDSELISHMRLLQYWMNSTCWLSSFDMFDYDWLWIDRRSSMIPEGINKLK